jgi:hypothetical protein
MGEDYRFAIIRGVIDGWRIANQDVYEPNDSPVVELREVLQLLECIQFWTKPLLIDIQNRGENP